MLGDSEAALGTAKQIGRTGKYLEPQDTKDVPVGRLPLSSHAHSES